MKLYIVFSKRRQELEEFCFFFNSGTMWKLSARPQDRKEKKDSLELTY